LYANGNQAGKWEDPCETRDHIVGDGGAQYVSKRAASNLVGCVIAESEAARYEERKGDEGEEEKGHLLVPSELYYAIRLEDHTLLFAWLFVRVLKMMIEATKISKEAPA